LGHGNASELDMRSLTKESLKCAPETWAVTAGMLSKTKDALAESFALSLELPDVICSA